jgi:hypothetical protein
MKIFTWHIHGSYLYYLSQGDYELYIPVNEARTEGYYGRGSTFPFGSNVHEVPEHLVKKMEFDLILFQTDENYLIDQYEILSAEQRQLPRIYLEHDPPWEHPTNAKHPLTDKNVHLVHVTHFNRLMWDQGNIPTSVIEHGVKMDDVPTPAQKKSRGIVVINNLPKRGRLLGLDIFEEVRQHIPLDLVGMGAEAFGKGEVLHPQLPSFISSYRFFFNPIRYTSLGLAVCEAMTIGLPIVGLATTEMAVTIKNGINGYVHTDLDFLIEKMRFLLENPDEANRMGANARETALQKFGIKRFTDDWSALFRKVIANHQRPRVHPAGISTTHMNSSV